MIDKRPERRILEVFSRSPFSEYSFRDIERETGLSVGAISNYVERLREKLW